MSRPAPLKLHHLKQGDPEKPVLLFLHGFMGSCTDWEEVIDPFSNEFHCIAVDLPGHGQSLGFERGKEYTFEGASRLILNTIDTLGIQNSTLIGYSMGGRLALHMALRYPARWNKVVIESASPGFKKASDRHARARRDEFLAQQLEENDFQEFLQAWYSEPLFASLANDSEQFQALLAKRSQNNPKELAKVLRGMGAGIQSPLWRELPQLEIPLLMIAGEDDARYRRIAVAIQNLCKRAQIAIVRGAGHNVHLEKPKEYVQIVRQFLSS